MESGDRLASHIGNPRRFAHRSGALRLVAHSLMGTVLLLSALAASAQTAAVRVEYAERGPDGSVGLQVAVLNGESVRAAVLQVGDLTVNLTIEQSPLAMTRWLILDGGSAMVNVQPAVQAVVERFLQGSEADLTGMVIYSQGYRILLPTNRAVELQDFLATYTASANQPGCLWDALTVLGQNARPQDRSVRILLVSTGLSQQSLCRVQTPVFPDSPVDMIVVAESIDPALLALAEHTGGRVFAANIQTIEARLSDVDTLWAKPVFVLRGNLGAVSEEKGVLTVTLAGGEEQSLNVVLTAVGPSTVGTANTIAGLATVPPRMTPTAPTEAAVAPSPTALTATVTATTPPTATAQPVTVQPTAVAVTQAQTTAPSLAAVIVSPAVSQAVASSTSPVMTPTSETVPSAVPATQLAPTPIIPASNPTPILVGSGLVLLAVALLAAAAVQSRRRQSAAADQTEAVTSNFYESLGAIDSPDGNGVSVVGQPQNAAADDDNLIITDVISEEQLHNMVPGRTGQVIGWLRLLTKPPQYYPVGVGGVTIGRDPSCDVVISGDQAVSRRHARIDVHQDGTVWITRLSTSNPLVVSGMLIVEPYQLRPHDEIHVSPETFLVFVLSTAAERP